LVQNKNCFKNESVVSLGGESGLTKDSNINKNSCIRAWNGFQTSDVSVGEPADDTRRRLLGHTIPETPRSEDVNQDWETVRSF
jgi:hypothetical protein